MNIILSGPPFSGKTTLSFQLTDLLGWQAINTDTLLEETYRMPCPEQYKAFGNEQFRKNETALISKLKGNPDPMIISIGGGTLTDDLNAKMLKELGWIVCLECSFDVLYDRLKKSERIPAYLDPNDLEGSYRQLLATRKDHYLRYGDFFVDVSEKSPQALALVIWSEYKRLYGRLIT